MTAYRDENEALRARLTHLEEELATERGHVARLKGLVEGAAPQKADSLVGEAVRHLDVIEIEGLLPREALEAIARVVRTRAELDVSVKEDRVTGRAAGISGWDGPKAFSLESGVHATKLRLETDLRNLPVAVAMGPVLGGLGSLPFVLYQMDLLHHFEPGESLPTTLSIAAAFMIFGTLAARWLARRRALLMAERHRGVWATVLELVRERIETPVRARVATEAGPSASDEAELDEARSSKPRARA